MAQLAAKTAATGKKPGGRPPAPPVEGPLPTDQVNLTDEPSRLMPVAGGGFEQCYNAQAVVAAGSLLVIAADVTQAPNDKQQLAGRHGLIEANKDRPRTNSIAQRCTSDCQPTRSQLPPTEWPRAHSDRLLGWRYPGRGCFA